MRFWQHMSSRLWTLTDSLTDHMVWREEEERYINLSQGRTQHLCLKKKLQNMSNVEA